MGLITANLRFDQMFRSAFPLMLAIQLGSGFGSASATVLSSTDESVLITIEVEVSVSSTAVVAHLVAPGEPQLTLPLLQRASGVFGITTDLPPIDYRVVFEALGETGVQSPPVSLTELGADFSVGRIESTATTRPDQGSSDEARRWGWLALALGAASLSALAFWVLGAGKEVEDSPEKL